jgi:hypothetical protein
MGRRLAHLVAKDTRVSVRNHFFTVALILALLITLVNTFLVPEDISLERRTFILDTTPEQRLQAEFLAGAREWAVIPAASREELETGMLDYRHSVGVIVAPGSAIPEVSLVFQRDENAQVRNLVAADVEAQVRRAYGPAEPEAVVGQVVLRGETAPEKPPFNKLLLPFWLYTLVILGMIGFGAALVFREKEDGTLRAYQVTPGRIWEYLLGKAVSLSLLGVFFAFLLALLNLGLGVNYLHLALITVLGSVFVGLLAITVANFFEDLTQFIYAGLVLEAFLFIPVFTYFFPSFAPAVSQWLPTYHALFAFREIVFPTEGARLIREAVWVLAIANIILLFLGSLAFRKQLERA